jgi:hypothetical protein
VLVWDPEFRAGTSGHSGAGLTRCNSASQGILGNIWRYHWLSQRGWQLLLTFSRWGQGSHVLQCPAASTAKRYPAPKCQQCQSGETLSWGHCPQDIKENSLPGGGGDGMMTGCVGSDDCDDDKDVYLR